MIGSCICANFFPIVRNGLSKNHHNVYEPLRRLGVVLVDTTRKWRSLRGTDRKQFVLGINFQPQQFLNHRHTTSNYWPSQIPRAAVRHCRPVARIMFGRMKLKTQCQGSTVVGSSERVSSALPQPAHWINTARLQIHCSSTRAQACIENKRGVHSRRVFSSSSGPRRGVSTAASSESANPVNI